MLSPWQHQLTPDQDHHSIFQDEVFGPFVVIGKFKTEQEAIKRANSTQYGLGAAVFTQNIARAHKVSSIQDAQTRSC